MKAAEADSAALLETLPRLSAPEQAERITRTGRPDEVLLALGDAAEQLAAVDAGRALAATESLVDLADALAAPAARARARRARAAALCHAGRLEEGWLACHDAARLAEESGEPLEAGLARLRSMQALGELGRFDESIAAGEAALSAFRAAGSGELIARAEVNLGVVLQRRDDPGRALEYFDRARPLLADAPQSLGIVDNNRGEALLALNDFSGAQAAFESALENLNRIDATLAAAVAEGNLADLAARQGRLPQAMDHFEQARRRLESTQSTGHLVRLLTEQAEAIAVLGLPADALREYEAAIPQLDRAGQALEAARARAGMGRVLVTMNRLAEAGTALAAAALAFEKLGHSTARARVDLVRAELAAAQGTAGEARKLVHGALAVLHDRAADAAAARHLLARIALQEGDLEAAAADLGAALGMARRLDLAPLLADLLHTSGRLELARGDLEGAVRELEDATAQIERVRGTLQGERFRAAWLGNRLAVYDDLFETLLEGAQPASLERAFAVAEQAKSRLLLEQVRGELQLVAGGELPAAADAHERRLLEELSVVRAELNALYSRVADGAIDAGWRVSVAALERRLEAVESRLSTTTGVAGMFAPTAGLDDAIAALPPETTLIEYAVAGGRLTAVVASASGRSTVRHLAAADELDERVARLLFQVNRALRAGPAAGRRGRRLLDDARAELRDLDRLVFAPLRGAVAAGRSLLIVPHGVLHLLPFHALWDGQRYLIERHEVTYAPSASVYVQLGRRPRPEAPGPPVVVGVPDAVAPRIDAEARRVAASLGCAGGDVLLGRAATAERFRDAAGRAGLLHLACHARFDPQSPLASGLRLADRWFTVRDIYGLRLDAELVTLAGCETGRALVRAGDELMGLLRGFFAAGARSALVSPWRVEDESSSEIMDRFYSLCNTRGATPRSKAAALRDAQLEALRDRPHPAFWAAFRLVGKP